MANDGITALLTGKGDALKDTLSFISPATTAPTPIPAASTPIPPLDDASAEARKAAMDAAAAGFPEPAQAVPDNYRGAPTPTTETLFADASAPGADEADDPWAVGVSTVLDEDTPRVPLPFGAGDDDGDPGHVPTAPPPRSAPVAPTPPDPAPLPYPDDDSEYGNDDDDDDYSLTKPSFGDLLTKPVDFFKRSPKLGRTAAVGAVGLVVAIGAGVMFGGSTASETPVATPPSVVEEAPGMETPGAEPVTLLPKAVSASCPPGSTSPSMAFTNRPENAWVCTRAHGIDGAVMNVIFPKTVVVKSITVMPGWNYVAPNGRDHWNEHRLVTKILWRIGGQQFEQNITPTRSGSTLTLPGNGIATTVMSLTILTTERPDAISPEAGGEGGLLAPGGDTGPENTEVDESTAIGSVTIMGTEI